MTTNPNTNRYGGDGNYADPQDVRTSIGFENIHRDAATGDMVVDVYFGPGQEMTTPNGGEHWLVGTPETVRWTVRPDAGIQSIDVLASYDGGGSYADVASGLPNTGSYDWTPTESGSAVRVMVRGHDVDGAVGEDVSNATFTIDAAPDTVVRELKITRLAPVPAREQVEIDYVVPAPAAPEPELRVFDLSGRRVATLVSHSTSAGHFHARWDLRAATGKRVRGGVYWLRLSHGT